MFNTGNCPSVPIVANLDGNNNGNNWNDGSWLWFLIVVFAIFGGWGNGFGGFGGGTNGGVGSEIQRGFDNQAVISKLDGISNGLCDGFYAMNNSMLTGFNGINTNIMQTGYGLQCYNYIFRHCKRLVLWLILARLIKSTLARSKTLKTSNTRL